MLISLRSQFIAGTAAVLGAGSVAVVGVQQQLPALPMPSVSVALSAFHNPIEQLLGVIEVGQDYIFGTYYNGIDAPTPGAGEANWPFAGFDQTGGDLLNYLLANEASLGFYNNVGLLARMSPTPGRSSGSWKSTFSTTSTWVSAASSVPSRRSARGSGTSRGGSRCFPAGTRRPDR